MKKLLLSVYLLIMLISACKRNDITESKINGYDVSISVADFSQTVGTLSKSGASVSAVGDTLSNHAKYLYCLIYPHVVSDGPRYFRIEQTVDSVNFGRISVNLKPGAYTIYMIASLEKITLSPSNFYENNAISKGEGLSHWSDLFYVTRHVINVSEQNRNFAVRLARQIGGLEVKLTDAIPQDASKVVLEVPDDTQIHSFDHGQVQSAVSKKEFVLAESDKGIKDKRFLVHVFNASQVTIRAFNSQGLVIAEKTVNNLTITKNKLTLLSGALFTTTAKFNITVNPVWDPSPQPIPF